MSVIQLVADVYREDRFIHSRLRVGILIMETIGQKAIYVARDIFYPTVYDSTSTSFHSRSYREQSIT